MKHTAYIAGAKHRGAQDYVKGLPDGTAFTLEAEPTNQYDPFAVKVIHAGRHVGYVPRDLSKEVAGLIERGRIRSALKSGSSLIIEWDAEE